MVRVLLSPRPSFGTMVPTARRESAPIRAVRLGVGTFVPDVLHRLAALGARRVPTSTTAPYAATLLPDFVFEVGDREVRMA